jgi:hypothetical protein
MTAHQVDARVSRPKSSPSHGGRSASSTSANLHQHLWDTRGYLDDQVLLNGYRHRAALYQGGNRAVDRALRVLVLVAAWFRGSANDAGADGIDGVRLCSRATRLPVGISHGRGHRLLVKHCSSQEGHSVPPMLGLPQCL